MSIKLISAPHTPFNKDMTVNLPLIENYGQNLVDTGVDGVFILGSTGEGLSLSIEERNAVASQWNKHFAGKLDIIFHIGDNAIPNIVELAKHAHTLEGIDSIAFTCPSYYKASSAQALVNLMKEVAKHAPSKGIYYYHTTMVLTNFDVEQLTILAKEQIPNFRGVKFNDINLYVFQKLKSHANVEVGFGVDEMFAAGLASGSTMFIGSTFNYMAPHYRKIVKAMQSGDQLTVNSLMGELVNLVRILEEFGGFGAGKLAMNLVGLDCGDTRLPIQSYTPEQKAIILDKFRATGLIHKL